jgi:ABC-2 type transport system ATP-binding protein
LEQGKIVVVATPEGLKDSLGESLLSVKLSQGSSDDLAKLLSQVDWVREINQRDGWLRLSVGSKGTKIPEVVRLAKEHGFAISSVSQHKPSLEDAFLHYVGKKLEGEQHE